MKSVDKKPFFVIVGVVCVVIIAGVFISHAANYATVLKANWGLSLPSGVRCTELYNKDDGDGGINGDGLRYHIFSYPHKDRDAIGEMVPWRDMEAQTIFCSSYSEAAGKWLDVIGVPEEWRPDTANCTYWYQAQEDNSELILFWNKSGDRLYVVESFL